MWLAVCSNKRCQWERSAESRVSAVTHLAWHVRQPGHRGAVVEIPDPEIKRWLDLDRLHRRDRVRVGVRDCTNTIMQ